MTAQGECKATLPCRAVANKKHELHIGTALLLIPGVLTEGSLKHFLQQPLLQAPGRVSCSLYLVHEPIFFFVASHLHSPLGGSLWMGVLTVLVSQGVATLFYRWFEKPVLTPEKTLRKERGQLQ